MIQVIHILWGVVAWSASFWVCFDLISVIMFIRGKSEAQKKARRGCAALKKPAIVGSLLNASSCLFDPWDNWGHSPLVVAFRIFLAVAWLKIARDIYRSHDDDDYWKKKRKKLAAKVKQLAGRLVVVPVPATN